MTSLATIFGVLPIALGIGAGGEARQPLGIAVVGGMLFSTLLTLVLVPVVYALMARFTQLREEGIEAGERDDMDETDGEARPTDHDTGTPALSH